MKAALAEHRNRAAFAISEGVPNRFMGTTDFMIDSTRCGSFLILSSQLPSGKKIFPGAMQFTRTIGASLRAICFVRAIMADFATE